MGDLGLGEGFPAGSLPGIQALRPALSAAVPGAPDSSNGCGFRVWRGGGHQHRQVFSAGVASDVSEGTQAVTLGQHRFLFLRTSGEQPCVAVETPRPWLLRASPPLSVCGVCPDSRDTGSTPRHHVCALGGKAESGGGWLPVKPPLSEETVAFIPPPGQDRTGW